MERKASDPVTVNKFIVSKLYRGREEEGIEKKQNGEESVRVISAGCCGPAPKYIFRYHTHEIALARSSSESRTKGENILALFQLCNKINN